MAQHYAWCYCIFRNNKLTSGDKNQSIGACISEITHWLILYIVFIPEAAISILFSCQPFMTQWFGLACRKLMKKTQGEIKQAHLGKSKLKLLRCYTRKIICTKNQNWSLTWAPIGAGIAEPQGNFFAKTLFTGGMWAVSTLMMHIKTQFYIKLWTTHDRKRDCTDSQRWDAHGIGLKNIVKVITHFGIDLAAHFTGKKKSLWSLGLFKHL